MATPLQLKRQLLIEFIAVCEEARGAVAKQSISKNAASRRLEVIEGIVRRFEVVSHRLERDYTEWGYVDKLVRIRLERTSTLSDFEDIKNLLKWFIHGPSVSFTGINPADVDQLNPQSPIVTKSKMAAQQPSLRDKLEKQLEELDDMRKQVEATLRNVTQEEQIKSQHQEASQGAAEHEESKVSAGVQDQLDEEERIKSKLEDLRNATRNAELKLADIQIQKSMSAPQPFLYDTGSDDRSRVSFAPQVHSSPYAPILKPSSDVRRRGVFAEGILKSVDEEKTTSTTGKHDAFMMSKPSVSVDPPPQPSLRAKMYLQPVDDELPDLYKNLSYQKLEGDGDSSFVGVNDPSRYLSKIPLTTFSGDKRTFMGWWTAFEQCVDKSCLPDTIKLMRLRGCLAGDAALAIEKLGHSAEAYAAAKQALIRKFGGSRRQLTILTDELFSFKQIRDNNAADLEKMSDLLDSIVVNLSTENPSELGTGYLYNGILKKLTPTLLTKYRRWMVDSQATENVQNLRFFIGQEAEFLTAAIEAIHGIHGNTGSTKTEVKKKKSEGARTCVSQDSSVAETKSPDSNNVTKKRVCKACTGEHGVWECMKYKKMSVQERWKLVKAKRLCLKCLGDHYYKKCWRKKKCSKPGCEMPHHETLHEENAATTMATQEDDTQDKTNSGSKERNEEEVTKTHHTGLECSHIAFRTVPIRLSNGSRSLRVNALLDDASNRSYLSNDVVAMLGLEGETRMLKIKGVGESVQSVRSQTVTCSLTNDAGTLSRQFTARSLPSISEGMKVINLASKINKWPHLKNIPFPKPEGTRVDVLIGIDYLDLMKSIGDVGGEGEPIARLTPLGWTCAGDLGSSEEDETDVDDFEVLRTHFTQSQSSELNQAVKKFWELEEITGSTTFTKEEQTAWDTAARTIQRNASGHYEIGVPWREKPEVSREVYLMAVKRLASTENRLDKEGPEKIAEYQRIIDSYLAKGYIRKVPKSELECEPPYHGWYLPHFPVIRELAETTKLRIVFDGSAKIGGKCLNSYIITGPKLQNCLVEVLLLFRKNAVVVSCDIQEMYLRVLLLEDDCPYHRFLWRNMDRAAEPDVYEFQRVVFGSNTSPFLAQFVAQHNAKSFLDEMPEAAKMIIDGTYMDDSHGSVHTEEEGIKLIQDVKKIWQHAGMNPHKWLSNSTSVLSTVPQGERALKLDLSKNELPKTKALGCGFDAQTDELTFDSCITEKKIPHTKREFLCVLATIFDPLGLLSPVIVRGKMLLQKCWLTGCEWDEVLPENLTQSIAEWLEDLKALTEITVPRMILPSAEHKLSLHMLSDSSEDAYGAVVYSVATKKNEKPHVNIVASKSKVAPLNATSIPRLELQAAVLGAKLLNKIAKVLEVAEEDCHAWVDSSDVLYWVKARSRDHKTFVANRISVLQQLIDPSRWKHISGQLNTADMISRGSSTRDLLERTDWFQGPAFLLLPEEEWPKTNVDPPPTTDKELKKNTAFTMLTQDDDVMLLNLAGTHLDPIRWSCMNRLTRILAYTIRAVGLMKKKPVSRGILSCQDLQEARNLLIRYAQASGFQDELKALGKKERVSRHSSILGLKPWIDDDGVLRANSRLSQGECLPWDLRYPIILPAGSHVTKLLVRQIHTDNHHIGVNATFSQMLQQFWIPRGRETVRSVVQECAFCHRQKVKPQQPEMAPLPSSRLDNKSVAFEIVSVDFACPFYTIAGRGRTRYKRYLCLYTCLHTRAVHLELVTSMTAQAFLLAFSRITARRGKPRIVYSDNGTNFVGGVTELEEFDAVRFREEIEAKLAHKFIEWRFQPPVAPHFSGIHESMIKSAKKALLRILPKADVSDEELSTAFCLTEQLLNDRPLTYQSMDERDLVALTPAHFLIGKKTLPLVDNAKADVGVQYRFRWRHVQHLITQIWDRWMTEWVTQLSPRKKWIKQERDLQKDDVVLVVDSQVPRGQWKLGRITQTFPGPDGTVRVVDVATAGAIIRRPAVKVCLLEKTSNPPS